METRKLQQVGGGTYTVSLPKAWADEQGLEAGTEVHLYPYGDGSVVVRSAERDREGLEAVTVELESTSPEPVVETLQAAYVAGFESVTLRARRSFTDEQRRAARRANRGLVGTEVVTEREAAITIRNLLEPADVSVRQSVVQLQFLALSIHRRATTTLRDGQRLDGDRLRERADEADRIVRMITRHSSRAQVSMAEVDRLGSSRSELFEYHETATVLARIVESGVAVAAASDRLDGALPRDLRAELGSIAASLEDAIEAAGTAVLEIDDVGAATASLASVADARASLSGVDPAGVELLAGTGGASASAIVASTRLLDALTCTADHARRLSSLALRRAVRDRGSAID